MSWFWCLSRRSAWGSATYASASPTHDRPSIRAESRQLASASKAASGCCAICALSTSALPANPTRSNPSPNTSLEATTLVLGGSAMSGTRHGCRLSSGVMVCLRGSTGSWASYGTSSIADYDSLGFHHTLNTPMPLH